MKARNFLLLKHMITLAVNRSMTNQNNIIFQSLYSVTVIFLLSDKEIDRANLCY